MKPESAGVTAQKTSINDTRIGGTQPNIHELKMKSPPQPTSADISRFDQNVNTNKTDHAPIINQELATASNWTDDNS